MFINFYVLREYVIIDSDYESLYANISGNDEVFTNERTPLLARRSQSRLKILTPIFVSAILLILLPGIIISIYLLIEDGTYLILTTHPLSTLYYFLFNFQAENGQSIQCLN